MTGSAEIQCIDKTDRCAAAQRARLRPFLTMAGAATWENFRPLSFPEKKDDCAVLNATGGAIQQHRMIVAGDQTHEVRVDEQLFAADLDLAQHA